MGIWLLRIAALALLATLLAGCLSSEQGAPGFRVTNNTDQAVAVFVVYPDGTERKEPLIHRLEPGTAISLQESFLPNKCVEGTLIARAPSGDEVARRSEPICTPGEWAIEVARRS